MYTQSGKGRRGLKWKGSTEAWEGLERDEGVEAEKEEHARELGL